MTREMGLSRTNFYAKLKAIVDITPVNYINNMRMQRAIELLQSSSKSISEIALEVGFSDHAYFSQVFKESTGFTPSEYR
ncbi:MAG: helix-turn-helix transcriptional regulator [Tidjanibacter sp.]|nr:helix-turn-helix transcriptional regulator [Tidjanibacter sp.]